MLPHFRRSKALHHIAILACASSLCHADYEPPSDYYDPTEGLSGSALKAALHHIIDDHQVIPYSAPLATDTWEALAVLDADPDTSGNVLLVYTGISASASDTNGNDNPDITDDSWEREHLWARSRGVGNEENAPDYSDLFNLRACSRSVNSSRGNRYFGEPDPFHATDPAIHPPNAPEVWYDYGEGQGGLWEPRPEEKGDIARSLFYMAVRYDGSDAGTVDLELTDTLGVSNTMAILSKLLAWHSADPVDDSERLRNHLIYTQYQGNRNPFIDHPEWVSEIFGEVQSGPPLILSGGVSSLSESDASVTMTVAITEALGEDLVVTLVSSDLDSLNVPSTVTIPAGQLQVSFTADPVADGVTDGNKYVIISAIAEGFSSDFVSTEVLDADILEGSYAIWINEFHYDNAGTDTNEFIEMVVGPQFTGILSDVSVVLYNGNNGSAYDNIALTSFTTGAISNGFQFFYYDFPVNGIQNGPPDGIAIALGTTLLSFISYEGSFTAVNSLATGAHSTDIGVEQDFTTPMNSSLYLTGTGGLSTDLTWAISDGSNTKGQLNTGQILNADSTLAAWLIEQGLGTGDGETDNDGDGIPAALEYALGGSVTIVDTGLWELQTQGDTLILQALCRLEDADMVFIAEQSSNLSNWTSAGVTLADASDQTNLPTGYKRVEASAALGANPLFLRLRVEWP